MNDVMEVGDRRHRRYRARSTRETPKHVVVVFGPLRKSKGWAQRDLYRVDCACHVAQEELEGSGL